MQQISCPANLSARFTEHFHCSMMSVMPSASPSARTRIPSLYAGTVTVSTAVCITAVCLSVMRMPARLRTSFHRADLNTVTGTITIPTLMDITAITLPVMDMVSRQYTILYRTDSDRITGTVTIPIHMIVSTIGIAVMHMPADSRTVFLCTDRTQMLMIVSASCCCLPAMMAMCRNRHNSCRKEHRTRHSQHCCFLQPHNK